MPITVQFLNTLKSKKNYKNSLKSLIKQDKQNKQNKEILRLAFLIEQHRLTENEKYLKKINRFISSQCQTSQCQSEELNKLVVISQLLRDPSLLSEHIEMVSQYDEFYEEILSAHNIVETQLTSEAASASTPSQTQTSTSQTASQSSTVQVVELIKIETKWNVNLLFISHRELRLFQARHSLPGKRYMVRLINLLSQLTAVYKKLIKTVESAESVTVIATYLRRKRGFFAQLNLFMRENLIESQSITHFVEDCHSLDTFYHHILTLLKYTERSEITEKVELKSDFLSQQLIVDIKRLVTEEIRNKKGVYQKLFSEKMPFLPVFYDLANDHIKFD